MSFLVSPGVEVKEIDLTGIVPAVSTSIGGYAGHFKWGPVGDLVNLGTEGELAANFGAPTRSHAQSYHTAATFLRYGNTLLVSRAIDEDNAKNASSKDDPDAYPAITSEAARLILSREDFEDLSSTVATSEFYGRYPGVYGNSLKVLVRPAGRQIRYNVTGIELTDTEPYSKALGTTGDSSLEVTITVYDPNNELANGDEISLRGINSRLDWVNRLVDADTEVYLGSKTAEVTTDHDTYILYTDSAQTTIYDPATGYDAAEDPPQEGESVSGISSINSGYMFSPPEAEDFEGVFENDAGTSFYAAEFGASNDEVNVMIVDTDGVFGEAPNTIIETFGNLSILKDAKAEDGSSVYFKDVINTSSKYVFVDNLESVNTTATDAGVDVTRNTDYSGTLGSVGSVVVFQLSGGADGTASNGNVFDALELFADAETLDVNLLFAENDSTDRITVANKIISICETRKDCVGFISPDIAVKDQNTEDAKLDKVLKKMDRLASSNYVVLDSSPLYVYDKYNDEYIWIPASGTVAGLCARTDDVREPWFSPAGFNRGQLLGVAQLAYNPEQNHRDELYKSRVNPIVSFPGEGIILFGDKTAQSKPSAFDRINVRRLFIVIEKAIATAAKFSLFEFNDEFTRAQFVNLIEPFLRDVQGRRGITDFQVVCDETNNTGEVIDSNRFVADIYIKPARAINFITLNFIATRTGVEFSEVIGRF